MAPGLGTGRGEADVWTGGHPILPITPLVPLNLCFPTCLRRSIQIA